MPGLDTSSVVSVLGALGIGSFVGQYLIGSQQRREVRGAVLRHLEQAESARWAGEAHPPGSPTLQTAMRDLETAALIARIPRKAVMHYKLLAYTGWFLSSDDAEQNPDAEYAGGINGDFANIIRAAAGEVSRLVWSPWLGRLGLTTRLNAQLKAVDAIDDAGVKNLLKYARKYLGM